MGLLLSVLVACVGVIELVAFYHNIKRQVTSPPVRGDLTRISAGFRKELHAREADPPTTKEIHRPGTRCGIPTFRLNSHEDIEVEYDEKLLRSRSSSPRTFLVTEKTTEDRGSERPRRFVVSDEPAPLKKSKSQESMPEFLIQEQNKPRYVLCDQQDPIPLPRQFIVTEDEINTLVFDETCRPNENRDKDRYRRSPSPYPPLELPPHVPRNSICGDLLENPTFSVVEYDEEEDSSTSTPGKVDMILESTNFNTTQYWTNKILVSPSKHLARTRKADKRYLTVRQRTRSKSESENGEAEQDGGASNKRAVSDLELASNSGSVYDEEYLNSLDGVGKTKGKPARRAFVKRRNATDSFEKAKCSIEDSPNAATTNTLSKVVEELRKISPDVLEDGAKGEPFWVKQ